MDPTSVPWDFSRGVWLLHFNGRQIGGVQSYGGVVRVTIAVRLAAQVVSGMAGSVEQGKRHAERWLVAWYRRPEVDPKPDWALLGCFAMLEMVPARQPSQIGPAPTGYTSESILNPSRP